MTLFHLPESVAGGVYGIDTNCQGDQIVVGAPYSTTGDDHGAVYVLDTRTGGVLYHLEPPCPVRNENFGSSVAFNCDGSRILVGSKKGLGSDPETNSPGVVFLYDILPGESANTTSFIQLLQTFQNPNPQDFDEFGIVTAMDKAGETIAIAAPNHDQNKGIVYVFNKNGQLIRYFRPSDAHDADAGNDRTTTLFQDQFFGTSVAMSDDGTLLLIGAPGKGWTKQSPGAVYLFQIVTGDLLLSTQNPALKTETLLEQKVDIRDAGNDFFASSVSMSADGEIIVVGAMLVQSSAKTPLMEAEEPTTAATKTLMGQKHSGQVYIFNQSGKLLDTLMSPTTDDHFGITVSMNAQGNLLLVAAPHSRVHEDTTSSDDGVAYLFDTSGIPIHKVYNPLNTISGDDDEANNTKHSMEFGGKAVLAPSGKYAVIGSPFHPVLKVACFLSATECPAWHPGKSKVRQAPSGTPPIITVQYDDIVCPSLSSTPAPVAPNVSLNTDAPSTEEGPIFRLLDGMPTTEILLVAGLVCLVLCCGATLMYLLFRNSLRSNATSTENNNTRSSTSCYLPNQNSDEEEDQEGDHYERRLRSLMMPSVFLRSPRRTQQEQDAIEDHKDCEDEDKHHEECKEHFHVNNIVSFNSENSPTSPISIDSVGSETSFNHELQQGNNTILDPIQEESSKGDEQDNSTDELHTVDSMESVDLESPTSRSLQNGQDSTSGKTASYIPKSLPEIV